jgi:pimeloyl-ACP methyl ester carboxylesterase
VLPASTDACITQALDSHYVYRAAAVAPAGKLLVFLPGTGAKASQYQLILAQAARAGYHAIGISYPNSDAIGVLCATQPTTCYGDARLEVVTGQATSSLVSVDRANSIENRVIKLVRFMRSTEPAGDWGQFLTGDTAVVWSKISIAGHSQGGGHALFIAQRYSVGRATAYGSYGDGLPGTAGPAPWVTRPFATPTSRMVGFISAFDELVVPLQAFSAWSAIGMNGDVVNVDDHPPPFGASQRFFTNAAPANRLLSISPNQNLVVLDLNTPKVGATSTPVFADVWRALSFP